MFKVAVVPVGVLVAFAALGAFVVRCFVRVKEGSEEMSGEVIQPAQDQRERMKEIRAWIKRSKGS